MVDLRTLEALLRFDPLPEDVKGVWSVWMTAMGS